MHHGDGEEAMSSAWRNREKAREREGQAIAEENERARLEARSTWLKIEEAESIDELKPILQEIAERLGAAFVSFTVTENVSVSLVGGEELSVTRTVML